MKIRSGALRNERGIALVAVLLIALAVAAISVGAGMLTSNASTINRYSDRLSTLETVAEAGIEEARSRLNGSASPYPDSGYVVLENGAWVTDASGSPIPNVTRWTYVGPTGVTSGQYGVFGSIVTVVEDTYGNRVVRRGEVSQESFAKYAYFTDYEPASIQFGTNDQIFGPVHSNSPIRIRDTYATFWGEVTTAQDVQGEQYGTFHEGYVEYAPVIPMPETADLTKLAAQATTGGTYFDGDNNGAEGEASTWIEFVALDLNVDGDVIDDDEGFIRVFQSTDEPYLTATGTLTSTSRNCGHFENDGTFRPAAGSWHPFGTPQHNGTTALRTNTPRCYPGGHPNLNGGLFMATGWPGGGQWLQWPGVVDPRVTAAAAALWGGGGDYLFPITRSALNPNFKGVIYVDGKVAISGVLRGRVTVVSSNDIVIVDDLTYSQVPGGNCNDILGMTAVDDIIIADNLINTPTNNAVSNGWRTYDETAAEFIHGVALALDIFTVQDYASPPDGGDNPEPCEGVTRGRGCLYLTGGIIQQQRGGVGTGAGHGYKKRYSYDQCALSDPPPYFPTTGHFARGRFFEVDPTGFDIEEYFAELTAGL